jgi:hypothetical protein
MARQFDGSSSAAASTTQSSGIDFTLELPPALWQDNENNIGCHNDNESVTRSAEHRPPSHDLVHSWMRSNSYGTPNYPVGDSVDRGDGGQVPGPSHFGTSGGIGWEQRGPVGHLVDQRDGGQIAGPSTLGEFGGIGWEEHGTVGNRSDGGLGTFGGPGGMGWDNQSDGGLSTFGGPVSDQSGGQLALSTFGRPGGMAEDERYLGPFDQGNGGRIADTSETSH